MRERNTERTVGGRRWMTEADIVAKYLPGRSLEEAKQIAREIVEGKEKDAHMKKTHIRPHPDAPLRLDMRLFLIWDESYETTERDVTVETLFECKDAGDDQPADPVLKEALGKEAEAQQASLKSTRTTLQDALDLDQLDKMEKLTSTGRMATAAYNERKKAMGDGTAWVAQAAIDDVVGISINDQDIKDYWGHYRSEEISAKWACEVMLCEDKFFDGDNFREQLESAYDDFKSFTKALEALVENAPVDEVPMLLESLDLLRSGSKRNFRDTFGQLLRGWAGVRKSAALLRHARAAALRYAGLLQPAAAFLEALLNALDQEAPVGPFVPLAFRVLAPVKAGFSKFSQEHNYTVLLLGQTGWGKTSLLNLIANMKRVTRLHRDDEEVLSGEELKAFGEGRVTDLNVENALDDPMASKTSDARVYQLQLCRNWFMTMIDTPGFGDSRGIDVDKEHVKRIMACLGEKVQSINCVMIVANGRESRMTATLEYVIRQLTSAEQRLNKEIEDATAQKLRLAEEHEELDQALEDYSHLGLRNAYKHLLLSQKAVLQERLETKPDDATLKQVLRTVLESLKVVEEAAEAKCCICYTNPADTAWKMAWSSPATAKLPPLALQQWHEAESRLSRTVLPSLLSRAKALESQPWARRAALESAVALLAGLSPEAGLGTECRSIELRFCTLTSLKRLKEEAEASVFGAQVLQLLVRAIQKKQPWVEDDLHSVVLPICDLCSSHRTPLVRLGCFQVLIALIQQAFGHLAPYKKQIEAGCKRGVEDRCREVRLLAVAALNAWHCHLH
ncbi:Septin-type G domain-containing protein [Durusdinium trenchii]|uniref:Septin-type G domain-containing protein n=1 Tax=Durusdinium trenchii TaxID=1381693 RepID=A0ABP0ITK6_9DINO